jgi:hypothetical protein
VSPGAAGFGLGLAAVGVRLAMASDCSSSSFSSLSCTSSSGPSAFQLFIVGASLVVVGALGIRLSELRDVRRGRELRQR